MAMKRGFTLIEVCLVMVVFGIAVSSLMALFPVSLRQGNMAVSDSVVTTCADDIMNTLAANAAEMTDWYDWEDTTSNPNNGKFGSAITQGVEVGGLKFSKKGMYKKASYYEGSSDAFLGVPKSYIGCWLCFEPVESTPKNYHGRLYRATLRVKDNKSASWSSAAVFVTYFSYMGEVP